MCVCVCMCPLFGPMQISLKLLHILGKLLVLMEICALQNLLGVFELWPKAKGVIALLTNLSKWLLTPNYGI